MSCSARTARAAALCSGAALLLTAATAGPAAAEVTIALWQMNEPTGASVMRDSSANRINGTVGSAVTTGVAVGSGKGYRFPAPAPGPAPTRLVTVPDNPRLDPGTGAYAITVQLLTTRRNANVVQKGLAGTEGGFVKLELVNGVALCTVKGADGQAVAGSKAVVADGAPHEIRCGRNAAGVSITTDGVVRNTPRPTGLVANTAPLAIGGKTDCDPGAGVPCDYFTGTIDSVKVTKG